MPSSVMLCLHSVAYSAECYFNRGNSEQLCSLSGGCQICGSRGLLECHHSWALTYGYDAGRTKEIMTEAVCDCQHVGLSIGIRNAGGPASGRPVDVCTNVGCGDFQLRIAPECDWCEWHRGPTEPDRGPPPALLALGLPAHNLEASFQNRMRVYAAVCGGRALVVSDMWICICT